MSAAPTPTAVDHDWRRFDDMSADERHLATMADPDAQPLMPEDVARMKRTPSVKIVRRALGWSEEQFARVFRIPVTLLREWESGNSYPNEVIEAYLQVIAAAPDIVAQALGTSDANRERQPYPMGPGSEHDAVRRYGDSLSHRQ